MSPLPNHDDRPLVKRRLPEIHQKTSRPVPPQHQQLHEQTHALSSHTDSGLTTNPEPLDLLADGSSTASQLSRWSDADILMVEHLITAKG
jgi:hypothetical protein